MIPVLRMSETPTLYEWAGGPDAFRRLIDTFYDRVEHDELLGPLFPGGVSEDHRAHRLRPVGSRCAASLACRCRACS